MGNIKLFNVENDVAKELESSTADIEKSLQTLMERHLETFLGIRLLATELSTGKTHAGRIDTLGIDENGCPVIIEYKRSLNQNVINQGLYYLDWLLDHHGDFEKLVRRVLGENVAETVDWSSPRLICIASDFTKYDEYAVQQISKNIELFRYRKYGKGLLLLEHINLIQENAEKNKPTLKPDWKPPKPNNSIQELLEDVKGFALSLGDDVQYKELKLYIAFKRIKNFACLVLNAKSIVVYVKLNPEDLILESSFTRDVRNIGHWGTGDVEIVLKNIADLEKAKPLILKSYEAN